MAMETTQVMMLQSYKISMRRMAGKKPHLWLNVKKHASSWLSPMVSNFEGLRPGDGKPFACAAVETAKKSSNVRLGRSSLYPFFPGILSIAKHRERPARVIHGLCIPMNGRLAGKEVDPCVWEYWNNHGLGHGLTEGIFNPRGTTTSGTFVEPVPWRNEVKRGVRTEAWLGRQSEEGDWQFSPEWWGTQGGGWGRNAGDTVFESQSTMGNGVIAVTAHPASTPRPEEWTATERELQQRQSQLGRANHCHGQFKVVGYEWRVLRFNTLTRQSVAKVMAVSNDRYPSEVFLVQQPNCIAFEYVKSMLSVGLTTMSLGGFSLEQVTHRARDMRILCIGLGGGSLPLFLAHNLPGTYVPISNVRKKGFREHSIGPCPHSSGYSWTPDTGRKPTLRGATLDVVEIDGAVIEAAVETMGYPPCKIRRLQSETSYHDSSQEPKHGLEDQVFSNGGMRGHADTGKEDEVTREVLWESLNRLTVYEADGEAFVETMGRRESTKELSKRQYYDLVFVDAFDGEDVVPTKLWRRNGPFLTFLSQLLHPKHGTVVVNLHTDAPPPSILEKASGQYGPGFDPASPQGRKIQEACWAYRDALISPATGTAASGGMAFTVAVPSQGNISLVASRGFSAHHHFETTSHNQQTREKQMFIEKLKAESKYVQKVLQSQLDFSKRVSRGCQVVQDRVRSAKVR